MRAFARPLVPTCTSTHTTYRHRTVKRHQSYLHNQFQHKKAPKALFSSTSSSLLWQNKALPVLFARHYASRRFKRRVQQKEQEDVDQKWEQERYGVTQQQQQQQETQPGKSNSWFGGWQPQSQPDYGDQVTEDAITPDVRNHLAKVYTVMSATMGVSALSCTAAISLGLLSPAIAIVSFLGAIGCTFATNYVQDENTRRALLYGVGALLGVGVGPLMAMAVAVDPMIILNAFLGTIAIFGGMSIAALRAKRGAFIKWGGPLMGMLGFLVIGSLSSMILAPLGIGGAAFWGAFHSISLYGGLALFSVFIGYDTQRMIENARNGVKDVTGDAMSMFLNVFQIFIRLVQIFMHMRD